MFFLTEKEISGKLGISFFINITSLQKKHISLFINLQNNNNGKLQSIR